MSVTVSDLLKLPSLQHARVIGGAGGLKKVVSSISVLESTDPGVLINEVFRHNKYPGSEIVITGFLNCINDVECQCSNLLRLIEGGEVGMVLYYVGVYLPRVDRRLIEIADANDFVLICMPEGQRHLRYSDLITDVTECIYKDRLVPGSLVSDILARISSAPHHQQTVGTALQMLCAELGCSAALTTHEGNILNLATWPSGMEDTVREGIERCLQLLTEQICVPCPFLADAEMSCVSIRSDLAQPLHLALIKVGAPLGASLVEQAADIVRICINIWGKQHGAVAIHELLRAILQDEPLKMRRLAEIFHVDVASLHELWMLCGAPCRWRLYRPTGNIMISLIRLVFTFWTATAALPELRRCCFFIRIPSSTGCKELRICLAIAWEKCRRPSSSTAAPRFTGSFMRSVDSYNKECFAVCPKGQTAKHFFCLSDSILHRFEVLYLPHSLVRTQNIPKRKRCFPMRENNSGFKIDESQRQSWLSIAAVWAGGMICVPCLMIGGVLAGGGLSLGQIVLSILIGYGLICVYMICIGMQACDTGLPVSVMASGALGEKGARYIISALLAIACVGWFGIQSATCGSAFTNMVANMLGTEATPIFISISSIVWGVIMLLTACVGFKGLKWLNYIAVPLLVIVCLYGLIAGIVTNDGGSAITNYAPENSSGMVFGISMVVASFALGGVISADYCRFAKSRSDVVKSSVVGVIPAGLFMLLTGALMSIVTGQYDISAILASLGVPFVGLVALVLATWTTNVTNAYSGGLALSNLLGFDESKFKVTTGVAGAIGTLLAAFGLLNAFQSFLSLMSALIPPLAGVLIASYWIVGKGKRENFSPRPGFSAVGVISFAIGAVFACITGGTFASFPGLVEALPFLNWPFFVGPVNGIVVSLVLYVGLAKLTSAKRMPAKQAA